MNRCISRTGGRLIGVFYMLTVVSCSISQNGTVSLEPNDKRAVIGIQVGDADEVDILVQEFKLDVVKKQGSTLLVFDEPQLRIKLQQSGYAIETHNSYGVFRRVVRIDRSLSEEELSKTGIDLINREAEFYIVEGTLSQLRVLVNSGVRLSAIDSSQPRPREIKVTVDADINVHQIGALGVDIYSAKRNQQQDDADQKGVDYGSIVVFGGAFDFQIDQLKELGYEIEILPDTASANEENRL